MSAYASLPKDCGHADCQLLQPQCCECLDNRPEPVGVASVDNRPEPVGVASTAPDASSSEDPTVGVPRHREGYLKYVDGRGFQYTAAREEWYCPSCKIRLGFVADVPATPYVPIDANQIPAESPITEMFMRSWRARLQRENEESDPARLWNPHANIQPDIPYEDWFCPHSAEWTDCRACIPDEDEVRQVEELEDQIRKLFSKLGSPEDEAEKLVRLAATLRRRREEERRLRYWRRVGAREQGREPARTQTDWMEWSPESVVSWLVGGAGREMVSSEDDGEDLAGTDTEANPAEGAAADSTCRVCFLRPVSAVIVPCGHFSLCLPCSSRILPARDLERRRVERELELAGQPHVVAYDREAEGEPGCPICRAPVEKVVQVFRV